MASRLVIFIVINIGFGFVSGGAVDNAAHLGGLVAGLWLGALVPPTGVPTLSSLWRQPDGSRSAAGRAPRRDTSWRWASRSSGVVVVAGVALGTGGRTVIPIRRRPANARRCALAQPVGGSVSMPAASARIDRRRLGQQRAGSGAATAASTER